MCYVHVRGFQVLCSRFQVPGLWVVDDPYKMVEKTRKLIYLQIYIYIYRERERERERERQRETEIPVL